MQFNSTFKKFLTLFIVNLSSLSHADMIQIKNSGMFAPSHLGNIELFHDDNNFYIAQDGTYSNVKKYWVDPLLQNISQENLKHFLEKGYISINQLNNKEFILRAHVRIKGGGPITAAALSWITRVGCYGTAAAGLGTVVVATGGIAGGAVGASTAIAGTAITGAAGTAAGAAGIAAGAIAGAGGATTAAMATTAVATSAPGGIAGAIGLVETAAAAAFAFGLALPTP